jgi:hypothetical protein
MQAFIARHSQRLIVISSAVLVILAFYTGFLEGKHTSLAQPVTLACKSNVLDKLSIPVQALADGITAHASADPTAPHSTAQGIYVGSKNSTKYYLPTCKAVQRIKPANYIWFSSQQDAEIQGYTQGKC